MKSWTAFKTILILFILLQAINTRADADDSVYRAISLKVLQERLKASQGMGSYPQELLQLTGLTRVSGYIVDADNHDIILFGEIEEGFPILNLKDEYP